MHRKVLAKGGIKQSAYKWLRLVLAPLLGFLQKVSSFDTNAGNLCFRMGTIWMYMLEYY